MRGRILFAILLLTALVAGYPYAAFLINRVIGTNTVVFLEHDGINRSLILGPGAPRPDWLPLLPRSLVVQAGHWLPSPGREIAGDVELLTHKDADEIKRFYLTHLVAAGFQMQDIGHGTLNAVTAAYLGIDNMLEGYRPDAKLAIAVTTRARDGLILPSRIVQIHWQSREQVAQTEHAAPPR